MRSFHTYLLFLLGVFARAQGPSCDRTITGRVIDDHDRTPLEFATVVVEGTTVGAVCDARGEFRIQGVCEGTLVLVASHIGCATVKRTVRVEGDLFVEIELEHHAEELKEFEIARERPDENVGQAHGSLDRADMEKDAGRTLGEMIARINGVNTLGSGPTISKPVIHGLSGNRVLILNQGVRQEDQQWGTEHAPNLDPFSSDRITVVKGAASVQYGSDAIGGVVITEPVELPREEGIGGELRGIGMLNGRGGGAGAMVQGGVRNATGLGWRVQGSGRLLGDGEAPGYFLGNTGVREIAGSAATGFRDHRWTANAYYSWFLRELGILRAAHIGNLTDLNAAIATGTPWYVGGFTHTIDAPRQFAQHHLVKTEAGYAISERDRVVIGYAYQADDRQEYDVRRAGRDAKPALDLFLTTHTADAVLKHWIGRKLHGKFGFSGALQENVNIPGTGVRPLLPNYRKQGGGVFLLEHLPIGTTLELEAGARIERTLLSVAKYDADNVLIRPEHAFTNGAFTLGLNWSANDSLRIRFNVGSAYRPPHVSELYSEGLHHGSAAIEIGDPGLRSERSLKAVLDIEAFACNGRMRIEATLHAGRIDDFIYLRPDGYELTIRGAFPVFRYVATDAVIAGVDAAVHYRLSRSWAWRLRGSTVHGRDRSRDEWLFQMPGDRVENTFMWERDPAGAWKALGFSATSLAVFEQRRVPVGVDFADPPPTYHLLSLAAHATRKLRDNDLRIALQATNLLNTAYRDYLDRFRYYTDALGIDVILSCTYAFGKP